MSGIFTECIAEKTWYLSKEDHDEAKNRFLTMDVFKKERSE